ncbi:MAG TPA: cation:proton antiporter [Streptosporangiaceae bacterium]
MTMFQLLARALPVLLALAGMLVAAKLAGVLAARLRQPPVIAEIATGLLVGAVIGTHGTVVHRTLGPLRLIGEAGLVLFLVGAAHEIRNGLARSRTVASRAEVGWLAAGAFVIPLISGLSLAGWVMLGGSRSLRGTAPALSFMLLTAIALSVTAVPVLARILADRNMMATEDGCLSLAAAVIIDALVWPLLAIAIAAKASAASDAIRPMMVLGSAVAAAMVIHVLLRTPVAARLCVRTSAAAPAAIALAGLAAAATTEHYGLTAILGAILVGLVIPPAGPAAPWDDSVHVVARSGGLLVPVYFVVTGMTVLHAPFGALPWTAILLATALALFGKMTGGYLGSRLGGRTQVSGLRLGVLMSTRGLTEIVVLQAGYSVGILTSALYAALIIMALATTTLTAPLLSIIDRRWGTQEPVSRPNTAIGVGS